MLKTRLLVRFALNPSLQQLVSDINRGNAKAVLERVNETKAAHWVSTPGDLSGVDYCRALCFLNGAGNLFEARQAVLEELRHTPDNSSARYLLYDLNERLRPLLLPPPDAVQAEGGALFHSLCDSLLDYTMLTWPRLLHLYQSVMALYATHPHATSGPLLECGTAGGGSAVLMAVALAHAEDLYEKRTGQPVEKKKQVFALDTYKGMPAPTPADAVDVRQNNGEVQRVPASASAWSTGTCAASSGHVRRLARAFGVEDRVVTVEGLFESTLPALLSSEPFADGVAMVHVDADWYQSVRFVLDELLTFLRARQPNGHAPIVVQVDDYNYWIGCKQAVEEALAHHKSKGGGMPSVVGIDTNAVYFKV
ncbi:macrocin-O-methyltransferase domain-containing protein [Strigomonas culicis]|uniref:Macrocin-O-methyltransferase domain-containing protein n=1 Tax=Strigomonas culicis TaxID=28005 RepID=S9TPX1_9TRYP|nr:macrocin-O-methyltransferase domain-containing protein [Strigomonas culicis]|eukprot:EPY20387.1 macrocin-O-methyltransferase domain-containing protein [Strigomonas culicis]